jgi:cephalosporin hydroxylase
MMALFDGDGIVVGIDIDIRDHNRKALENHPLFKRINLIQGSSIDELIVDRVRALCQGRKSVMVILDSNHTHQHVLKELFFYAPFVTKGSYCVVFDTIIEHVPHDTYPDRPWGKGNNPKTAVRDFLRENHDFVIDSSIQQKLLITVAPDGYLRKIR